MRVLNQPTHGRNMQPCLPHAAWCNNSVTTMQRAILLEVARMCIGTCRHTCHTRPPPGVVWGGDVMEQLAEVTGHGAVFKCCSDCYTPVRVGLCRCGCACARKRMSVCGGGALATVVQLFLVCDPVAGECC
eukprot:366288-Chlamydomonas_euryale.AAC.5